MEFIKNVHIAARVALVVGLAWALSGCVAGQSIALDYEPADQASPANGIAVKVAVSDAREFITDGRKSGDYIGHYRAGFGNTWDVKTQSGESLQEIFKQDLAQELESLGFSVADENWQCSLDVTIRDWNFDTYTNGRLWYDVLVRVVSDTGAELVSTEFIEEHYVDGSVWVGPKYAMEENVPRLYGELINKAVRNNANVLSAMKGSGE